jgi:hypothetical protein
MERVVPTAGRISANVSRDLTISSPMRCAAKIRPKLGAKKVESVDRRDIEAIHVAMKDRPYQANRVLSLLSKMFKCRHSQNEHQSTDICPLHLRFPFLSLLIGEDRANFAPVITAVRLSPGRLSLTS